MMILLMKTGLFLGDLLLYEIGAISKNLRVEKRNGCTRLQLAQHEN
jgi:membrane protein DedA with SNARE-associated domain